MRPTSTLIIGGGISGLTTAWWLKERGVDVTLLEKESTVGGTMKTLHEDEWLIETGPNSALDTTPLFGHMFDKLGILGERIDADPSSSKRYILRDKILHALPTSPGSFLGTRLWSIPGKLRLLKEPFIKPANKEETIAEFVERRLGREFLDYAINPFVAGIYAGNPEQLSVRAAFPKLFALEKKYGGLIKGMILGRQERKQRSEKAKDRAGMFSFNNGMETFPLAIGYSLRDSIKTGCTVYEIAYDKAASTFRVRVLLDGVEQTIDAGSLVIATPARDAVLLLRQQIPSLGAILQRIYYPPVAEVFLGFHKRQMHRPLDGFGYLIPAKEKRKILGTIWSSSLFPNRAPKDHVALTSFVGGSRQPEVLDMDDAYLVTLVERELQAIMQVEGRSVFSKVIRWERAIPQYNIGHLELMREVSAIETSHPGLFFCNNFRGGIAVGDCVMSGERTAGKIANYLKERMSKENLVN